MGVILCRPFQKQSISTPTIMGDVGYSEVDSTFIQVVEQCQQVTLGILVPQLVVFAEGYEIGRVEIYQVTFLKDDVARNCR